MKMNEDDVFPVPETLDAEKYPYTMQYIMLYGISKLMAIWDLKEPFKSCEEVYKECIEKEITWEELLDFKKYNEDVDD